MEQAEVDDKRDNISLSGAKETFKKQMIYFHKIIRYSKHDDTKF